MRTDEVARGLAGYLSKTLGVPSVEFAEPPVPLGGGFDTEIFAFRLRHGPAGLDGPLVLRVLRPHHDPARMGREAATQNALAARGYPAPGVVLAELDPAPLGAAFAVMERAPGVPLLSRPVGMGGVLARAQLRLHALDPEPLRDTLPDLEGYLDALARRVDAASLTGLAPLLDWLRGHRPRADALVICHGDFHPQNVLVQGATVTAVLDWPNALVAEPAFDVASTLNILRFVPAGLTVTGPLAWLAGVAQQVLAARYLAVYRRGRPLDAGRLAYYEVAAALRALVRTGEVRRQPAGGPAPSALDRSPYAARLLARAARLTRLEASLP